MSSSDEAIVEADLTWTGSKFERGVRIACAKDGRIKAMGTDIPASSVTLRLKGQAILPGMVNVHSHAFHRGLRGKSIPEPSRAAAGLPSNFWSWRKEMYDLAENLAHSPQSMYTLYRRTFEEMLAAGITTVGEFHYLHHSKPYASLSPTERYSLDQVVLNAAADAGIRIVLLETFYEQSGVLPEERGKILESAQHYFHTPDPTEFWQHIDSLRKSIADTATKGPAGMAQIGVAAHSVRAVDTKHIGDLYRETRKRDLVFHIHLEEQQREVDDCQRTFGKTPSSVLWEVLPSGNEFHGKSFTAVHCTRSSEHDMATWASKGINVCLCPLTEGCLGDGIPGWASSAFPSICLGSDCNARICFFEEMRWAVYLQQMLHGTRGIPFTEKPLGSVGELFRTATANGAKALGLEGQCGVFSPGYFLDFFAVDLSHRALAEHTTEDTTRLLEAMVFGTAAADVITGVCVGGRWRPAAAHGPLLTSAPPPHEVSTGRQPLAAQSVTDFLCSLMAVESVTGNEAAVAALLADHLEARGWNVIRQPVGGDPAAKKGNGRVNIYARPPRSSATANPRLLLNSHLDTVPPHIPPSLETVAVSQSQHRVKIKGRGACDAKGMVAAMVFAAERWLSTSATNPDELALLFVVGEEVDHSGMVAANELFTNTPNDQRPEFLICGEPTGRKLASRQKGILKAILECDGVPAHSGYPNFGKSAVDTLLDVLQDLRNTAWPIVDSERPASADNPFEHHTTLNIGVIKAGEAANVLAAHAEAMLMFRLVTPVEPILEKLTQVVAGRAKIRIFTKNPPVELSTRDAKGRPLPFETTVVAYNTDIPYFHAMKPEAAKAYIFGPGLITDAHCPREYVWQDDLEQCVDEYVKLITLLLGS